MSKIALLVGIDHYTYVPLAGCVNDAQRVHELLRRHEDESPNFECQLLVSKDEQKDRITRPGLKQAVENLFTRPADVALLFFAGHGTVNNLGGYLVTQDAAQYDEGLSMVDVLTLANKSPARERIVILDCCHSGALGSAPAVDNDTAMLREGVSVLSASRASETAKESNDGGLFTSLVCDALEGGGADVCGKVTVASVYAYADETLGGFDQRPLFKSHVAKLVPLRNCQPAVSFTTLRLLPKYFPSPQAEFALEPSYEPTSSCPNPEHEAVFNHLQKLRAARLVIPVGEEHMYYAAMRSKSCKLTPRGAYYWRLANSGRL